jgi:hypothetical protein
MSLEEFKPAVPARERPQTNALARAAAGFGIYTGDFFKFCMDKISSKNGSWKGSGENI